MRLGSERRSRRSKLGSERRNRRSRHRRREARTRHSTIDEAEQGEAWPCQRAQMILCNITFISDLLESLHHQIFHKSFAILPLLRKREFFLGFPNKTLDPASI